MNEKAQTIFRVEKNADNPFVMIDRRTIENPKLSWKAKGLLAYLLSRPDDWVVRFRDLVKRAPDGAHTVRAALKELRDAGHVQVIQERAGGHVKQWVYKVYEVPLLSDFQQVEKQEVEIQQVENRTFNNTNSTKKKLTKKKEEEARNPLFSFYENKIGPITPLLADAIEKAEKEYSSMWVTEAIEIAAQNRAHSWRYCEKILNRWKTEGRAEKHNGRKVSAAASGDPNKYADPKYVEFLS